MWTTKLYRTGARRGPVADSESGVRDSWLPKSVLITEHGVTVGLNSVVCKVAYLLRFEN
jgi:hypothetical protein